jgi:hypothetical protein
MLIRVKTDIILDVKDKGEAEDACIALDALDGVLRNNSFPHGDVVMTDTNGYEEISDAEAEEMGLTEE